MYCLIYFLITALSDDDVVAGIFLVALLWWMPLLMKRSQVDCVLFFSFSFLTYNNQDIDLFGKTCFSSISFTSFDDLLVGWSKLAVQGALSAVYCINLFHTKKIYDIFKVLTWEKRSKSFHLHVKFVAPLNRHLSLNPIWEMEVSIVRNGNINTPYC